jgi:hypothetical protein
MVYLFDAGGLRSGKPKCGMVKTGFGQKKPDNVLAYVSKYYIIFIVTRRWTLSKTMSKEGR